MRPTIRGSGRQARRHVHDLPSKEKTVPTPPNSAASAGARVILVTGATDGLGRYVVTELVKEGHRVIAHGRSPETGWRTKFSPGTSGSTCW